jgi:hypothetical protein
VRGGRRGLMRETERALPKKRPVTTICGVLLRRDREARRVSHRLHALLGVRFHAIDRSAEGSLEVRDTADGEDRLDQQLLKGVASIAELFASHHFTSHLAMYAVAAKQGDGKCYCPALATVYRII